MKSLISEKSEKISRIINGYLPFFYQGAKDKTFDITYDENSHLFTVIICLNSIILWREDIKAISELMDFFSCVYIYNDNDSDSCFCVRIVVPFDEIENYG